MYTVFTLASDGTELNTSEQNTFREATELGIALSKDRELIRADADKIEVRDSKGECVWDRHMVMTKEQLATLDSMKPKHVAAAESTVSSVPRVNLNGTSRDALVQQRREVCDALLLALQAMERCAPHGRDYQTSPQGAFESARRQYEERCSQLNKLRLQIIDEAIDIQNQ